MALTELDLRERRAIEEMLHAKVPVAEIAAAIGRHRSTVYREIGRNGFVDDEVPDLNGYYGVLAQRTAQDRRARRRKLIRLPRLRDAVVERLKDGWSPEQIAGRLHFEAQPVSVSDETVYAFVYGPDGQSEELARHLPSRRKKRRPRYARRPRGLVFPSDRSIHERPVDVKSRETFGDWEGDLMIFERAQGNANVASLVERVSRFAVLLKTPNKRTQPVIGKVIDAIRALPLASRKSITFDRGTEFVSCPHLQAEIGTQTWFCDPFAPWQKGTVENTNRRARRWLPRKLDPTALSDHHLKRICERLNNTPRKCLGWKTPADVFKEKTQEERA